MLAACLLMLPISIAIAWSASRSRAERLQEARDEAGRLAVTIAAYLDQYLAGIDTLASSLTLNDAVVTFDHEAATRVFDAALAKQPQVAHLELRDTQGTLKASARSVDVSAAQSLELVRQVLEEGARVVGELVSTPTTRPFVPFAYPVRTAEGAVGAVLIADVDLSELQSVLARLPMPQDAVVGIADARNRFLVRTKESAQFIGTEAPTFERAALPMSSEGQGRDGIERYFGVAPAHRAPWILSLGIPRAVAAARVLPLWRRNLAVSMGALGASFLLSLWLASVLSRNLTDFRAAIRRVAAGDLSSGEPVPGPNRELTALQAEFLDMARSLSTSQDAVKQQVLHERRLNETLQSLQGQVVRQERLAAVGALAAGLAHELNNPLQAIQGATQLLERQASASEMRAELDVIKAQCRKAGDVVRSLSRFSSQPSGPPEPVNLREVAEESLKLSAQDAGSDPVIAVRDTATRRVLANAAELEQVTLSLVINARQAIARGNVADGRIEIAVFDVNDNVRLEVRDNGPGVDPEDEARLFQPFFTRKPVGQGTGLGLSVSYGIIRSIGGTIGYSRNDRGGATFFFELPAIPEGYDPAHDRAAVLRQRV
jgi:C4-dicarboxylate-specific signal transduction histidine kinase